MDQKKNPKQKQMSLSLHKESKYSEGAGLELREGRSLSNLHRFPQFTHKSNPGVGSSRKGLDK